MRVAVGVGVESRVGEGVELGSPNCVAVAVAVAVAVESTVVERVGVTTGVAVTGLGVATVGTTGVMIGGSTGTYPVGVGMSVSVGNGVAEASPEGVAVRRLVAVAVGVGLTVAEARGVRVVAGVLSHSFTRGPAVMLIVPRRYKTATPIATTARTERA